MSVVNSLYPIFLKTEQLQFLVVGGGKVALEKLTFLFRSSPNSKVRLIAPRIDDNTLTFIQDKPVTWFKKNFEISDLKEVHIVICATNNTLLHRKIHQACRLQKILINVADTPHLCDFYMGAIVTKGDLKIGISTNGKSPTLAKRIRQWLEQILPEDINESIALLQHYRKTLSGDFDQKIKSLNEITKSLLS